MGAQEGLEAMGEQLPQQSQQVFFSVPDDDREGEDDDVFLPPQEGGQETAPLLHTLQPPPPPPLPSGPPPQLPPLPPHPESPEPQPSSSSCNHPRTAEEMFQDEEELETLEDLLIEDLDAIGSYFKALAKLLRRLGLIQTERLTLDPFIEAVSYVKDKISEIWKEEHQEGGPGHQTLEHVTGLLDKALKSCPPPPPTPLRQLPPAEDVWKTAKKTSDIIKNHPAVISALTRPFSTQPPWMRPSLTPSTTSCSDEEEKKKRPAEEDDDEKTEQQDKKKPKKD